MEETMIEAYMRLTRMVAHGSALKDVLDAGLRFCESRSPDMLCSILLLEDGRTLRHGSAPSLPADYIKSIDGIPIGPMVGSCGTAAYLGKPVIVEDILRDPLWAEGRKWAEPHGLRACWSTPIFDAANQVMGTFAIYYRRPRLPAEEHRQLIELITGISAIAIAACRAEREKRMVFERISDAFVALDLDWRFSYVNAKAGQLFGRAPLNLVGKHIWTEFPESQGQRYRQRCEMAMAEQISLTQEEYHPQFGKWFESRIYPSREGLTVYFHDVTDRRLDEERSRQADKLTAIGHLAGGVAHDFNNELAVILGYAGLLENRLTDSENQRFASAILRAANRSGDLTRNLLAFSRQGQYEKVVVDMHELVADVCELLAQSQDQRIEVIQELRSKLSLVKGDPAALRNALLNLALNASDAMPHGGRLVFSTAVWEGAVPGLDPSGIPAWRRDIGDLPEGAWMLLDVRDSGTGMTAEVKRHVFEPFFTTKPVGKGTGLGLASVFGTVKIHGGRIAVESSPDMGTIFHLVLPVATTPAEGHRPAAVPTSFRPLRVLVVDDDAPVREIMNDMLRAGGHLVREAGSGREAVEAYRAFKDEIDLVILDLMMADMDGSETFAALQRICPSIRVLLSTGYPGDLKIPALIASGVKGLLQKPYEKSHLDRMIAAAMG